MRNRPILVLGFRGNLPRRGRGRRWCGILEEVLKPWPWLRSALDHGTRQQVTRLGLLFTLTCVLVSLAAFVSANNLLFPDSGAVARHLDGVGIYRPPVAGRTGTGFPLARAPVRRAGS